MSTETYYEEISKNPISKSIQDGGWSILDVAISPDSSFAVAGSWGSHIFMFPIKSDSCGESKITPIPIRRNSGRIAMFSVGSKFSFSGVRVKSVKNSGS